MAVATHPGPQKSASVQPVISNGVSRVDDIEHLREMYIFSEDQPIEEFLAGSPQVVAKLLEAREQIDRVWGTGTPVVLDIFIEYDNLLENHLFGFIQTSEPVEDAIASLRRFDREWWTTNGRDIPTLNFDVRFP